MPSYLQKQASKFEKQAKSRQCNQKEAQHSLAGKFKKTKIQQEN